VPQNQELPAGLDAYEFYRDFKPSSDLGKLFHYVERLHPQTAKPVLTHNLQPDIKTDWDWSTIFPDSDAPIHIEIGSGKGNFITQYALKNPHLNILGIEWDPAVCHYAARRLVRNHIPNAAMLRADTFYFLRDLVPANSVSAYHMYFPDPWPKAKHHKNRLMLKDGFLDLVYKSLVPGERPFYWGTDFEEYNQAAVELFTQTPFITIQTLNDAEPTLGIITNFEKKYREEGRAIFRSELILHKQ
jgi:tRNA (guanine-N7-)-methyltransferase